MSEGQIAVNCYLKTEKKQRNITRLWIKMHCAWIDNHRAEILNRSMFNRAAMHIHEGPESAWMAVVTTTRTHRPTQS